MYLQSFFTDLQCYMELLLLSKGLTPIGDFSTILITYSLGIFLSGKYIANVRRKRLLFTGASHVSATPLEHHLSMVSPTLLTYHMKVNSGDME